MIMGVAKHLIPLVEDIISKEDDIASWVIGLVAPLPSPTSLSMLKALPQTRPDLDTPHNPLRVMLS